MTPFSQRAGSTYTTREKQSGADGLRIVYLLAKRSAHCCYSVLILTHRAGAQAQLGWTSSATGRCKATKRSSEMTGLRATWPACPDSGWVRAESP